MTPPTEDLKKEKEGVDDKQRLLFKWRLPLNLEQLGFQTLTMICIKSCKESVHPSQNSWVVLKRGARSTLWMPLGSVLLEYIVRIRLPAVFSVVGNCTRYGTYLCWSGNTKISISRCAACCPQLWYSLTVRQLQRKVEHAMMPEQYSAQEIQRQ